MRKKIVLIILLFKISFLSFVSCSLENTPLKAKVSFTFITEKVNKKGKKTSKNSTGIPAEVGRIVISIWQLKDGSLIDTSKIKSLEQVEALAHRHHEVEDFIFQKNADNSPIEAVIEFFPGQDVFLAIAGDVQLNSGDFKSAYFGVSEPRTFEAGQDVTIRVGMNYVIPVEIEFPLVDSGGLVSPLNISGKGFPGAIVHYAVTDIADGNSLLEGQSSFSVGDNSEFDHPISFAPPQDKLRIKMTQSFGSIVFDPIYIVLEKELSKK